MRGGRQGAVPAYGYRRCWLCGFYGHDAWHELILALHSISILEVIIVVVVVVVVILVQQVFHVRRRGRNCSRNGFVVAV